MRAERKIKQDVAAADILAPKRRGVGAGCEEHRVTERYLSRLQQQDDAEHDNALGADQREQRGPARDEQPPDGGHQEEHGRCISNRLEAAGHQIFLIWTAPNNPNGRASSTSTISR